MGKTKHGKIGIREEIFSARINAIRNAGFNIIGGNCWLICDEALNVVGHSFDELGFATIRFDCLGFKAEVKADLRSQEAFEDAFRTAKKLIEAKCIEAESREEHWHDELKWVVREVEATEKEAIGSLSTAFKSGNDEWFEELTKVIVKAASSPKWANLIRRKHIDRNAIKGEAIDVLCDAVGDWIAELTDKLVYREANDYLNRRDGFATAAERISQTRRNAIEENLVPRIESFRSSEVNSVWDAGDKAGKQISTVVFLGVLLFGRNASPF